MGWLVSLKVVLISIGVGFGDEALRASHGLGVERLKRSDDMELMQVIAPAAVSLRLHQRHHHHRRLLYLPQRPPLPTSSIFHNDHHYPPHPIHLPPPHVQDHVAATPVVHELIREDDVVGPPVVIEEAEVKSMVLMNNNYLEAAAVAEVDHDVTKLDEVFLPAAKPLVSSRFSHRKSARSTPEGGRPLRVSKAPKRHDTLENTWKTITEGRPIPLSRHIKKTNDTSDHLHGRGEVSVNVEVDDESTSEAVNKSNTFRELTKQQQKMTLEAVSSWSPASVRLRKEPLLSQDELNRRVEAFIHKFNEDMRLQRRESLNQFMEMINRGSN